MNQINLFAAITIAATSAQATLPIPSSQIENAAIAAVIAQARRDADAIASHLEEHRAAHRTDAPGWPCVKPMPRELAVAVKPHAVAQDSTKTSVQTSRTLECDDCAECVECGDAAPDHVGCSGCREPEA